MAELNQSSNPAFILAGEQHARQQLAAEMKIRNADPLDEAKREGGFYLNADGVPMDAEGREIKGEDLSTEERSAVKAQAESAEQSKPRRATPAKAKGK